MKYLFFLLPFISLAQNSPADVEQLRLEHLEELLDTSTNILNLEEIEEFEGLDYFDYDSTYVIKSKIKGCKGKPFEMITTTERRPVYRKYGHIVFELNGTKNKLNIYQPVINAKNKEFGDYLFIPFRDKTSANETYGGGRYIDMALPSNKSVTIDFNLSYNPYCAYSYRYSCPVPPASNTLNVEIKAGEKTPLAH
ncbi:MAG: DUF1684 domain-containing protein [Crocinitomicaceae bacterium]